MINAYTNYKDATTFDTPLVHTKDGCTDDHAEGDATALLCQ